MVINFMLKTSYCRRDRLPSLHLYGSTAMMEISNTLKMFSNAVISINEYYWLETLLQCANHPNISVIVSSKLLSSLKM